MGLLKTNVIHTVISTLNPPTQEVYEAELNLIRAASQSGTVKRYAPSEWGIDWSSDDEHLPLSWKGFKSKAVEELKRHPNLEYTQFYNGYFMDYFGMPHVPSHMLPEAPYIDVAAGKAAIPGSGDDKVVFTYTKDVAKYVRKAVESSDTWPLITKITGDCVTLNEVVAIAEGARGIKFDITYNSLEDLRAGKITEIPAYKPAYEVMPKDFFLEMMAGLGIAMVMGVFDIGEDTLNERYPAVKPVKMVDLIKVYWEGR